MDWSPWKYISRTGTIPADLLPCEAFQLSWFLEWELDPMGMGFSTHHGRWKWQIIGDVGNPSLFYSDVNIYGIAIWLLDELIAWYIEENANNPVIKTSIPIRPPMLGVPSSAPSWHQRSDGSWANEAEAGTIVETGWNPGAGLETFPVYMVYDSAEYLIDIPAGATVNVPYHDVGAFLLPKIESLQIRTIKSASLAAITELVGIHRIGQKHLGAHLAQQWSADRGATYEARRVAQSLTYPSMAKRQDNTLFVAGKLAQADWRVLSSRDDGLTWLEDVQVMWDAGYADAKIAVAQDGAIVTTARKGGVLYCRTSRDGFVASYKVGLAPKAFELDIESATGRLLATDGVVVFASIDGGMTWAQQAATFM